MRRNKLTKIIYFNKEALNNEDIKIREIILEAQKVLNSYIMYRLHIRDDLLKKNKKNLLTLSDNLYNNLSYKKIMKFMSVFKCNNGVCKGGGIKINLVEQESKRVDINMLEIGKGISLSNEILRGLYEIMNRESWKCEIPFNGYLSCKEKDGKGFIGCEKQFTQSVSCNYNELY